MNMFDDDYNYLNGDMGNDLMSPKPQAPAAPAAPATPAFKDENHNGIDDSLESFEELPSYMNKNNENVHDESLKELEEKRKQDVLNDYLDDEYEEEVKHIDEDYKKHVVEINPDGADEQIKKEEEAKKALLEQQEEEKKNIVHREPKNLKLDERATNFQFDVVAGTSKETEEALLKFAKLCVLIAILVGVFIAFRQPIMKFYHDTVRNVKEYLKSKEGDMAKLEELNKISPDFYGGYIDTDFGINVHSKFNIPTYPDLKNTTYDNNIYQYSLFSYRDEIACTFRFGAARNFTTAGAAGVGIANFYNVLKTNIDILYYNNLKWYVVKWAGNGKGWKYGTVEKGGQVYVLEYEYLTRDNTALGKDAREDECHSYFNAILTEIK